MNPPVLELRDVRKSFSSGGRRVEVLKGVSLELPAGRMIAVVGPSGCGKTTLLHLAALLDRPDSGRVVIDGVDASSLDEGAASSLRARAIGMVFQRFHLLPHRSALANVRFRFRYTATRSLEALRQAREALEVVGLGPIADRPARLLSGGEMQRVALARALAMPPRLLLADEPTGNLDSKAAEQVMRLIGECRDRGIAVLLATHNPAWMPLCDSVVRLDGPIDGGSRPP